MLSNPNVESQVKLPYIYVRDFDSIQSAIDSLNGQPGKIIVPVGTYYEESIVFKGSGQILSGESTNGVFIKKTTPGTLVSVNDNENLSRPAVNRCGIENILLETMADNSKIIDLRKFNYAKFINLALVARGKNTDSVYGYSEDGIGGYYNYFENVDMASTAMPISTNGNRGYAFVNNPNATTVGNKRRAPNSNMIIGGRISGQQTGYIDYGTGNKMFGTTFESNFGDMILGSEDMSIYNPGTTNQNVIVGTYHEAGTTTHTVLKINPSAARITWMPTNVTGYSVLYQDNGTRNNILFFGSGLASLPGKISGYLDFERLSCKESAWNKGHFALGTYRLWVDSAGRLRIKNGAPISDTDGTIVGTQS